MENQQSCHCHLAQLRKEQERYFLILVGLNDLPVRGNLSQISALDGSCGQMCSHLIASPNAFGHRGGLCGNCTFFDGDTAIQYAKKHE